MRKVRKRMGLELHKGEEHWTGCDRDAGVFFDLVPYIWYLGYVCGVDTRL